MRLNKEKFKEIMQQQDLTLEIICTRTGLYKRSLEWIMESGFVSEEALERIADAAGVEVKEIFLPDISAFDENTIEFTRDAKRASVTVSQQRFMTKLQKLAETYPEECEIVAINHDPKERSQKESIYAHIPVRWIKISPPREVSEERREKQRQLMNDLRARNVL